MALKELISALSEKSKFYESDFFPSERLNNAEGRFELLGLSILDVNNYDADKLWYLIAPKLRERNIISINYLQNSSVEEIQQSLIENGYNRGNYTKTFAERLKQLCDVINNEPYQGDISTLFNSYVEHNQNTIEAILKELKKINGIGQKVGTMFIKFMLSTFHKWEWRGDLTSLLGIAAPNDFQVRKVYTRFIANRINDFENELSLFSNEVEVNFIEIDNVFWNVGRIFCNQLNPACHYCPLEPFCKYAEFRRLKNFDRLKEIDEFIE